MAGDHRLTDADALDAIAHMLRDPEWGVGMLEDIAPVCDRHRAELRGHLRRVRPRRAAGRRAARRTGAPAPEHEPEQTWDRH